MMMMMVKVAPSTPEQTLGAAGPSFKLGGLSASEKCTKCIDDVLAVLTQVSKHGKIGFGVHPICAYSSSNFCI